MIRLKMVENGQFKPAIVVHFVDCEPAGCGFEARRGEALSGRRPIPLSSHFTSLHFTSLRPHTRTRLSSLLKSPVLPTSSPLHRLIRRFPGALLKGSLNCFVQKRHETGCFRNLDSA
ncbi:unnamed protein product [Protopolystoma xenopodis]|uniref:Uncharacterized protein n=1 Tax=Protopolystoma xenopodis TaxID=117903 RepID=A0A448X293_9PLAT|nr:unnamed protein product [Protopolystoma xenopodis]